MSSTDESPALRQGYRDGRPTALEQVYRLHIDDVGRLLQRGFLIDGGRAGRVWGVPNPEDQVEIAQEVFTKALSEKARLAYDPSRPLRPYLLRIARNLIIDRLRRTHRANELEPQGEVDIDEVIERNAPIEDDPATRVDRERLRQGTRTCVSRLDEEGQEFCRLRYDEELGQIPIAERLEVTRRRVRSIEARVRKAVAACLRAMGLLEDMV